MLTRCVTALLLPRAPVRVHTVGLRAAPQKYDDTTAPLAATLRSSEFAAAAATGAKALAPSIGLAILGTVAFGPLAVWLRTFINGEGLAVLANDEGQYFQNYVNAIDVMFSLLLVNTFAWLYNQQEQLYVSLFAEVSVAKALLEQIAYVSRGRPEYAAQLLENVRRYVDDDLTKLSAEPVTALLGGSPSNYADPLEQVLARRGYLKPFPPRAIDATRCRWSRVCSMAWRLTKSRAIILRSHQCAIAASGPRRAQVMWLTSVGSPGDVYETVRSLREARGQRLGALQRKLPAAHFGLLAVLGVLVLAIFPLLAAATGAAVAPEDGLLRVQAVLFGLMTFAIAVTLAVLYAFWMPAGSAYNVDAVLEVMIDGLRAEIDERERAVDDAFAGRGDDARPGNPS